MRKILRWVFNGETGISSKQMAATACGIAIKDWFDRGHPLDPADFNRCLKLVRACPEVKAAFPKIAKLSREWRGVIEHWDEIRRSFLAEAGWDWSKSNNAPKTYELMRRIEKASREGAHG